MTFGFRDGLQRHMEMVHYQLRPYSCVHCGQKFKTKSHVLSHSFSLHPEKHDPKTNASDKEKHASTKNIVVSPPEKPKHG